MSADPASHPSRNDPSSAAATSARQGPAHGEDPERTSPVMERLLRWATIASVTTALVLIAAKTFAWFMTGSVSVLSTLIDSLMDASASLINFFAVRRALKPADTLHRFGHGKAEPLAGLAQAAFVAGAAVFLVFEAVSRLGDPRQVTREEIGIAVMLFSIVLTLSLVAFQTYVVRRTRSVAIRGDSLHYKGDILIHSAVILSLLVATRFDVPYLDPLLAIAIALYLLWTSADIARQALRSLMDQELPAEDRQKIIDLALAHPSVCDVHDLRTRHAGPRSFIQFHLELPQGITLMQAHVISDEVEAKVRAAFPGSGVIIHQDPEGIQEHRAQFLDEDGNLVR